MQCNEMLASTVYMCAHHVTPAQLFLFCFVFLLFNAAYTHSTRYQGDGITPIPNLQLLCVTAAPICVDWQVIQQSTVVKS